MLLLVSQAWLPCWEKGRLTLTVLRNQSLWSERACFEKGTALRVVGGDWCGLGSGCCCDLRLGSGGWNKSRCRLGFAACSCSRLGPPSFETILRGLLTVSSEKDRGSEYPSTGDLKSALVYEGWCHLYTWFSGSDHARHTTSSKYYLSNFHPLSSTPLTGTSYSPLSRHPIQLVESTL